MKTERIQAIRNLAKELNVHEHAIVAALMIAKEVLECPAAGSVYEEEYGTQSTEEICGISLE